MINRYWKKLMTIKAGTDLEDRLFHQKIEIARVQGLQIWLLWVALLAAWKAGVVPSHFGMYFYFSDK